MATTNATQCNPGTKLQYNATDPWQGGDNNPLKGATCWLVQPMQTECSDLLVVVLASEVQQYAPELVPVFSGAFSGGLNSYRYSDAVEGWGPQRFAKLQALQPQLFSDPNALFVLQACSEEVDVVEEV